MSGSGRARGEGVDALLLAALVRGGSWVDASNEAGVAVSTVGRRMADDRFREQLASLRADVLRQVCDRLAAHAVAAVDVLAALAGDSSVQAAVRCGAAKALLDSFTKFRDSLATEDRLQEIEKTLAALAGDGQGRAA